MLIRRLRLNQYRNYSSLDLRPGPGINAIVGDNAQGKTNAAEAIFLCALGRSHRTPRDNELIMNGCAGGYVGVELESNTGVHTIEMKLRAGERKNIFIDRRPAARTGELMGILNAVMFAPEDIGIVREGPAERRRFMDMEISQCRPAYFCLLQRYNAALRQRNALLKGPPPPPGVLEVWDGQLAAAGAGIMAERRRFIRGLSAIAGGLHRSISGGGEGLEISYAPSVEPGGDAAGAITEALKKSAGEDMRRGFTACGPHRDDISISVSGGDLRAYGSQGQKRTAALSLKLSELILLKELNGEFPVLILDDVLSELDGRRQGLLMESIQQCQCFLTCTSLESLKRAGFGDMQVFRCENGGIRREA